MGTNTETLYGSLYMKAPRINSFADSWYRLELLQEIAEGWVHYPAFYIDGDGLAKAISRIIPAGPYSRLAASNCPAPTVPTSDCVTVVSIWSLLTNSAKSVNSSRAALTALNAGTRLLL